MTDEQTVWRDVSRSSKRSFHHLRERRHMNARPFGQTCCTTTPAAMAFWGFAFVLVYGLARVAGSFWPAVGHYGDTIILASLGVACFANFARNRTLHCGLSGPIFVVGALVAAAVEAGVWDLDLRVIWGILLAAVAGALLIEWRTVGRRPSASNAAARA
jgi:hypothetical protein